MVPEGAWSAPIRAGESALVITAWARRRSQQHCPPHRSCCRTGTRAFADTAWKLVIDCAIPHSAARSLVSNDPLETYEILLGLILMSSQAFFYNAIFFTYGLVLPQFLDVNPRRVSLYLLPLALGNFAGPLVMGPLFDSIGRRRMIAATYAGSGLLMIAAALFFRRSDAGAIGLAIWFSIISFIASSAASSAYLTVSEIFPVEVRAFAISIFYAAGTLAGGVGAPLFFGHLIQTGSRIALFRG